MEEIKNDIKIVICGKEYKLKTAESPNYVFALARALEGKIYEVSANGASPYSAAIMVALSVLDDLNKANQRLDSICTKTKEYVSEAGKVRMERDTAVKEMEILKAKVAQLENIVKMQREKGNA